VTNPEITPVAAQRRHTLFFLREFRSISPVFLDTEVDARALLAHRASAAEDGRRYSIVSYLLQVGGRVLAAHPEANAAMTGGLWPKVARFPSVAGKLALDRRIGGKRVVLAAVLPGLENAGLDAIQDQVEHYRDGDPDTMPEFAGARKLHSLPALIGRVAYRKVVRPLAGRARVLGTFSVTSLGHRPVDGFHSVGGTTITLGVGRIAERAVVVDGEVAVVPTFRLSLAFDHRVIDGAEAADVLADLVEGLTHYGNDEPVPAKARLNGEPAVR
jgi:pyruvate/2-oxoglutarate dehydrogenase complex dihydrolipoamide acyltransferase (E2) component